ncbi:MAG: AMP-binding protein, partial [Gammaproteobacteria bacterium]|nr:AMP-binding protein [Gammaproteobacteria bacterium]
MALIRDDITVRALLEERAVRDPEYVYLRHGGADWTVSALDQRVNRLANALADLGIGAGDRVPLVLANHPDYVVACLALAKLGALQVPLNTRLAADGLAWLLEHCEPALVIADVAFGEALAPGLGRCGVQRVLWRRGSTERHDDPPATGLPHDDFHEVAARGAAAPPPGHPQARDPIGILYTSGTTGPPKGVLLTDKMLRAAAFASAAIADARDGDVLFVWEPLYHIGGVQVLVLALEHRVTLHMVDRFSATRFWDQVREAGATQIHFLGGILQLLLRQPASTRDRDHPVRIAWGGGAPAAVWREFEGRFGIEVRENYGMTEASSLTTM